MTAARCRFHSAVPFLFSAMPIRPATRDSVDGVGGRAADPKWRRPPDRGQDGGRGLGGGLAHLAMITSVRTRHAVRVGPAKLFRACPAASRAAPSSPRRPPGGRPEQSLTGHQLDPLIIELTGGADRHRIRLRQQPEAVSASTYSRSRLSAGRPARLWSRAASANLLQAWVSRPVWVVTRRGRGHTAVRCGPTSGSAVQAPPAVAPRRGDRVGTRRR